MRPAMYIFINKGLGMSTGKTTAQGCHAAVKAADLPESDPLYEAWNLGGHYMKLVMECRDAEHLLATERYLNDRGFKTVLIIDEGHTEIDPITPTALGVQLVDKDDPHTAATFESFRLYKDFPTGIVVLETDRINKEQMDRVKKLVKAGQFEDAKTYLRDQRKPRRWWHRKT